MYNTILTLPGIQNIPLMYSKILVIITIIVNTLISIRDTLSRFFLDLA